jgi:hypothetical protein
MLLVFLLGLHTTWCSLETIKNVKLILKAQYNTLKVGPHIYVQVALKNAATPHTLFASNYIFKI